MNGSGEGRVGKGEQWKIHTVLIFLAAHSVCEMSVSQMNSHHFSFQCKHNEIVSSIHKNWCYTLIRNKSSYILTNIVHPKNLFLAGILTIGCQLHKTVYPKLHKFSRTE